MLLLLRNPNCNGSLSCLFFILLCKDFTSRDRVSAERKRKDLLHVLFYLMPVKLIYKLLIARRCLLVQKDILVCFVLFKLLSPWLKCKSHSLAKVDLEKSLLVMNF